MGIWYTTREAVKAALDFRETARNNGQIDRAIEAASRTIDGSTPGGGQLHRRFYPELDTRSFPWPNEQHARSWRLWLDANELISVTTLTSGGTTIAAADFFLEPVNSGPPYNRIEIDLASSAAFSAGDTHQRSIAITGTFGHSEDTTPAGALAEALDATETAVDVTDSALIGVGSIIKVDSERMIVTGKTMLDTTQNTGGALTASNSDVTVAVTTGTSYAVDETILIDSERMLIVDIAGNNLTVKRAYDGSVLAAHGSGSDIYAPRTLTVTRGALGTTAATHDTAAAITAHVVPGPVASYALGLAINDLLGQSSGYSRTVGEGDNAREASGRGIRDLYRDAYTAYGRKARTRAV